MAGFRRASILRPAARRAGLAAGCFILGVAHAQISITGVADKATYTDTATFTVVTQAGYNFGATLNDRAVAVGQSVEVGRMDYYDLRAWRTNLSAPFEVVSNLVRFIVLASDRGSPEKGLIKWTPYPRIPSTAAEFQGAQLHLMMPREYPPGLPIPVEARVDDGQDRERRVNGEVNAAGFEGHGIAILRGHGSGFLPAAAEGGTFAYHARLHALAESRQVTIDSNTSWSAVSGTLPLSVAWPENARIHLTAHLTIPTNGTLTVGAGTVVKLNPLVNITNAGRLVINGTPDRPVVFTATSIVETERYPSLGWGSLLLRGGQASIEAQGAIFAGGGGGQSFDFSPAASHKSAQATLLVHHGARAALTNCAIIFNAGQVANGYASTIIYDHCLFQRAITSGEYSGGCNVTINHSAIIEFPSDDGVVNAAIADGDYDGIYFTEGTYTLMNSLIGFAKDDAIDSGSGAAGTVTVTNCWIESALHEAMAWSCDGVGRVTRTYNTVAMNSGQGLECGWGRGVDSPACYADGLFSTANAVGARIGDNYNWQYLGFLKVTNSLILHNDRDIFLKTWNTTGSGWDTNSWVDRLGQADFRGNRLTAADSRFPENEVWDPATASASLARWMTIPPQAPVGIGLAVRTNWLTFAEAAEGVPVRLSSFTTQTVSVDYVLLGTNGPVSSGTLTFEAGETVKVIAPLPPAGSGPLLAVMLENPRRGEITGQVQAWVFDETQSGGTTTVPLVTAGSGWRYLDTGADAGAVWQTAAYDDQGWSNGLAQLGFSNGEEDDEATLIRRVGTNGQNSVTFYFRQWFLVPDPALFTNVSLWMLRDDGGVVYLNGTEVFRSDSLPPAPAAIGFRTLATNYNNGAAPPDNTIDTTTLVPTWLQPGTNLVAVEIHQQAQGSSDLSFDFRLSGHPWPAAPVVQHGPESQTVALGGTATFRVEARGGEPMGFLWWRNTTQQVAQTIGPVLALTGVTAADAGTYHVEVVNRDGAAVSASVTLSVPDADSDGDGMPNGWEQDHGLDPFRDDATGDADADGQSNWAEFVAGTDPQEQASILRLAVLRTSEGNLAPIVLLFEAVAGRAYRVEFSDSLPSPSWLGLTNLPPEGANRTVTVADPGTVTAGERYYRVLIPAGL